MASFTASQIYLSTRGGSYGLSFEEVVLTGLASDNGLFIPEEIPSLPSNWQRDWLDLSFQDLAFQICSLYISPTEIPPSALKDIVHRSYSTFSVPDIAPTVTLDSERKLYLLELFHGPTLAFKDVALQFLGNLLEFFLVRKNEGKVGKARDHLTVICATSGDTGSAAIYGLRGKKDVSIFIMYPDGKVSPVQEAQMTTVQNENIHCLNIDGTFDDCQPPQEYVKTLFSDDQMNTNYHLTTPNSVNFARILAQISYYFASYFSLIRSGSFDPSKDSIRFITPSGNFGNVLAGYFAKSMGLPIHKLVVATNENDILYRFWQTGTYEKQPVYGKEAQGGIEEDGAKAHPEGVKETLSPAMDILVSSNFERLLWFLAFEVQSKDTLNVEERRKVAAERVKGWQSDLRTKGAFSVDQGILNAAKKDFVSERVSDQETISTIRNVYQWPGTPGDGGYILDPHSAIGVTAALRSTRETRGVHHVALATAHPAKFSRAVEMALGEEEGFHFKDILPPQFVGLEDLPRRVTRVKKSEGLDGVKRVIIEEVRKELEATWSGS
ncbi:threonine synthase [Usnea florida]